MLNEDADDRKRICYKSTKKNVPYLCDGKDCMAYICIPNPLDGRKSIHGCRETLAVLAQLKLAFKDEFP